MNASSVSEAELISLLNDAKSDIAAAQKWVEANLPDLAPLYGEMKETLAEHEIKLSTSLGDAGFLRDAEKMELIFNVTTLQRIYDAAEEFIAGKTKEEAKHFERMQSRCTFYTKPSTSFKNFERHETAGGLKRAFGADELSKFDLVADVAAANCWTMARLAKKDNFDVRDYLLVYSTNILLSYNILCRVFKTSGADHKKKRALGLLTSLALGKIALDANDPDRRLKYLKLATTPAFTSIDRKEGMIMALTTCSNPGGWKILFGAESDPDTISDLWDGPEDATPDKALGILLAAYKDAPIKDED